MKTLNATFSVGDVNKMPVAEAIATAKAKAVENNDTALLAEIEALSGVDWEKVPFTYKEFSSKTEYESVYSDKDLLDLVNTAEKANAKSKEYQRVTKCLRPDPKSPEVKRASMIKNLIDTFGYTEANAIATIDAMIAGGKSGAGA